MTPTRYLKPLREVDNSAHADLVNYQRDRIEAQRRRINELELDLLRRDQEIALLNKALDKERDYRYAR